MSVSREEIMAYVDGELDETTRARITMAALSDLDLADQIAQERALREKLQGHFAPVIKEPVPAAWEAQIRAATPPAPVIDLAAVRRKKAEEAKAAAKPKVPLMQQKWFGGAIAAALVLGLVGGGRLMRSEGPIADHNGTLMASGDLAHALDTQLASAQDGAATRMIATFRNGDGNLCRAFSGASASGIACHGEDGWKLQHVMPGTSAQTSAYRQAGSGDGELMALAQGMAKGDPLDPAQEAQAKAKGWR